MSNRWIKKEVSKINIWASADYIAFTYLIPEDLGKEQPDGTKVVKAGTVYPSNDENAIGIVVNDVDVTRGDREGAVAVDGIVLADRLPEEISEEALGAMKKITIKEMI